MSTRILTGDCRAMLATLPDASVQCCVSSPPYFGLRDYGVDGQIGLEQTPDAYVAEMVAVFREVRRVLRDDGVLWLNLGDSYATGYATGANAPSAKSTLTTNNGRGPLPGDKYSAGNAVKPRKIGLGDAKPKDLLGIPWMVAFALRADGWWLRSDIIWSKPNPMPESVTDRPTSAHEHVFMLSKRERYFFDAAAVAEPALQPAGDEQRTGQGKYEAIRTNGKTSILGSNQGAATRNLRNVWSIATQPYSGAHFATMPPDLAERCIKAGTKAGDTVLDPFAGAGTTLLVADRLGRNGVGIELNPQYADLARDRLRQDNPLFAEVA